MKSAMCFALCTTIACTRVPITVQGRAGQAFKFHPTKNIKLNFDLFFRAESSIDEACLSHPAHLQHVFPVLFRQR